MASLMQVDDRVKDIYSSSQISSVTSSSKQQYKNNFELDMGLGVLHALKVG